MKRLSCVSKVFLDLTAPYFTGNSLINIKEDLTENHRFFRNYRNIKISRDLSWSLSSSSLQNIFNSNESLKVLNLGPIFPDMIIPEKCQLVEFSIGKKGMFFDNQIGFRYQEAMLTNLRHQHHLAGISIFNITLSNKFFESVKISKDIYLHHCRLRDIAPLNNNLFDNLQYFHISGCSFETMKDFNSLLTIFSKVKALKIDEIYIKNLKKGKLQNFQSFF